MNPQYKIDYAFEDIFDAYAYVKTSIVFDKLIILLLCSFRYYCRYNNYNTCIQIVRNSKRYDFGRERI